MILSLAHFFLPRKSNNHKAKLIQSSTLVGICFLIILSQGLLGVVSRTGKVLGYAANISPEEVIRLTNEKRTQAGLAPLTEDPVLSKAAMAKGADMLNKGYWAHISPDGTQPWAFFINANYEYRYAGENLARDFSNASSAVDAWMASASHRENMLSSNYKNIGIGVVEGNLAGVDTTIIVQFFGTRMGDKLPVAPLAKATESGVPATVTNSTPAPIANAPTLVATNQISPFDITKYLSFGIVGVLIGVVAVDGILINRRKVFRVAGHFPAHIAFLGMILTIVIVARAGRII